MFVRSCRAGKRIVLSTLCCHPVCSLCLCGSFLLAAEVESRQLTHYVPQDFLETAIRTEGWTEVTLNVKGGVRKGDVVRIWAGGSIDRGNGEQPGQNVNGPGGHSDFKVNGDEKPHFVLS